MTDSAPHDRRVALVTGAARSHGRAVALAMAGRGAAVALLDAPGAYQSLAYPIATADELHATAEQVGRTGAEVLALEADVRDPAAVGAAVRQAEGTLGPLTDLVVCSGVVSATPVSRMSRAAWDEVLATNVTGAFHLSQAAVPGMVQRGYGHAVFVTGQEARRGFATLSHVAAAGWALVGLAKTIALEVAASGVTVNVVATAPTASRPLVDGDSYQAAMGATTPVAGQPPWDQLATAYPQGRPYVEPEEVAAAVEFLVSPGARSWTGAVIDLSLGGAARNSA